jgi:hypothetical protein
VHDDEDDTAVANFARSTNRGGLLIAARQRR